MRFLKAWALVRLVGLLDHSPFHHDRLYRWAFDASEDALDAIINRHPPRPYVAVDALLSDEAVDEAARAWCQSQLETNTPVGAARKIIDAALAVAKSEIQEPGA